MRNVWEIYLELNNLEEEIDRIVLKRNRERLVSEKERLNKEIDRILAKELEIKHKLERIKIDIDI